MAGERYILKPLTSEDGMRGHRLGIDEFLADNEMINLFLIALASLQKDSLRSWNEMPDWLTYYSLAGIHGFPREEWNGYLNKIGSTATVTTPRIPFRHGIAPICFFSSRSSEMIKQAHEYPSEDQRKIYLDAAARFRLPYWDPITPRKAQDVHRPGEKEDPKTIWALPDIFKKDEVFVKLPKNDPKNNKDFSKIANPLASFTFP
ncbi:hypothetical protein AOQ84DRAFT_390181 [Glonium stellatum]|uniref:Uncharacterized protein n=1 Tax=Glonium stellatum TaxID=574774 RepID=A0A8E2EX16_9PEZI|nr:hypothetical protein AOQ84DRAFT_390181 [Glonium stellatum]